MNYSKYCKTYLLFLLAAGAMILFFMVQSSMAAYFVQPAAYWQLEQADPSTTLDDIGTANGTCTTCPTSPAAGQIDNAYDFSPANAEIIFADNDVFDFGNIAGASFSIELWMKLGTLPVAGNPDVFIGRFGSPAIWWVGVDEDGTVACFFNDSVGAGEATQVNGYSNIVDDIWHHIVIVRDGTADTLAVYVDGVLENFVDQSEDNSSDHSFNDTAAVTLGQLNSDFYYGGMLDNVSIYNDHALTVSVIHQNYRNGRQGHDLDDEFAPVFNASASDSVDVGFNVTIEARAAGNPIPTYSATGLPAGASIDGATGDIAWLPTDAQVGVNLFSVDASNSQGPAATSQNWTVNVDDLSVTSLSGHWKLDATDPESEGTLDETGSAHGTCTNCPDSAMESQVGNVYDFSAQDAEIVFADSASLDLGAAPFASFSIKLWMKLGTLPVPGDPDVIIGRFGNPTVWWIGVDEDGTAACYFNDSVDAAQATKINGYSNIVDDNWHHIVVVRDGATDTLSIYVDDALEILVDQSGDASSDDSFDATADMTFGHLNSNYYYDGLLDEVTIYAVALSWTTITQHFNSNADQYNFNAAPVISTTSPTTAIEGQLFTYDADVTDVDSNTLRWHLYGAPVGMTVDAATGEVAWTPMAVTAGDDVSFALIVTDGEGGLILKISR